MYKKVKWNINKPAIFPRSFVLNMRISAIAFRLFLCSVTQIEKVFLKFYSVQLLCQRFLRDFRLISQIAAIDELNLFFCLRNEDNFIEILINLKFFLALLFWICEYQESLSAYSYAQ